MATIDKQITSLITNKMTKDIYKAQKALGAIDVINENYEITDLVDNLDRIDGNATALAERVTTAEGDITDLGTALVETNNDVKDIVDGNTPVGIAKEAVGLANTEKVLVDRTFSSDVTAGDNNEIINKSKTGTDGTVATIDSIGFQSVKQVLKEASEVEVLTTKTPIAYVEGLPTTVVDGQFVISKPKQIISKSNNLLNLNDNRLNSDTTINNDVITTIFSSGALFFNSDRATITKLKPNTKYTFTVYAVSTPINVALFIYDKNFEAITNDYLSGTKLSVVFTTPSDGEVSLCVAGYYTPDSSKYGTYSYKLQLNEGTTALPYQPFAEHIIDLVGDVELVKLPNGVGDRWNTDGSVEKKVGKVVLNGSENWEIESGYPPEDTTLVRYNLVDSKFVPNSSVVYSGFTAGVGESITIHISSTMLIVIIKKENVWGGTTSQLFKDFLALNPIELLHQLSTPIIETAEPLPTYIDTYTNGTIIVDNGQFQPSGNVVLNYLYENNCVAGEEHYVSCDIDNKTDLKIRYINASGVATDFALNTLDNKFIKFVAPVTGRYFLSYIKDGVNKIKNAQWFNVTEMNQTSKTAIELKRMLGNRVYPFGESIYKPVKLVSIGDNLLQGDYSIILPDFNYKKVGSGTITFYNRDKISIGTTTSATFTTPYDCYYISSSDYVGTAIYHASNAISVYLKPKKNEIDIPSDISGYSNSFVAYNYGLIYFLDEIGKAVVMTTRINYSRDIIRQIETNTDNIRDYILRLENIILKNGLVE